MIPDMADNREDYRTGRHVVFDLHVHVVLVTKYRRGVITDRVRAELERVTREVCARHDVSVEAIDGTDDHLHLLLSYPPKLALSTLIGAVKTNTSREVRAHNWSEVNTKLWGEHFWSPSYAAIGTGGKAPLETVKRYIENQRHPGRGPGRPKQPR